MLGVCKWFNEDKGYGFITPEVGSKDIFVHVSALYKSGIKDLKEGDKVSFDTEQGKKGVTAVNLKLLA